MADTQVQGETPETEETVETAAPSTTTTRATPASLEEALARLERAERRISEVNRENAGRRKRVDELEAAETRRKDAELSETERLAKASQDLEGKLRATQAELTTERIASAAEKEARDAGFEYPEDVVRLIDLDAVEIDDTGKVKGMKKAVAELATRRPGLLKATRPTLGTPPRNAGLNPRGESTDPKHQEYQAQAASGRYGRI